MDFDARNSLKNSALKPMFSMLMVCVCVLFHFGAFRVAQLVKNLPAVWETWVQSLCREEPLEEGMATQSSILAWSIPMDRGA